MSQTFFDSLGIPAKCFLNKTLFKKHFLESGVLDVTDKKTLKDDIEKIRWVYTLKPSTINIEPFKDDNYEYDEIAILQIDLSSNRRIKRIISFINKAIPYPLILVFDYGEMIAISVMNKRINQADKSKWVVGDEWTTPWFNPNSPTESEKNFMGGLAIKNLSFLNFYAFYSDIKNLIVALTIFTKTGIYSVTKGNASESRIEILRALEKLEQDKLELQNKIKKETQMGRQVALTTSIKKMADQINYLKQQLTDSRRAPKNE